MTTNPRATARSVVSYIQALLKLARATTRLMTERFRSASLRFKIAFFVLLLLTSSSFVLCFITVQIMNNYILNEIIKRGESVGKSIAASAGYSLLSKDLLGLDNLVFKAKSTNTDMAYAAIVNKDMKTIVHSETVLSEEPWLNSKGQLFRMSSDGTTVRELAHPSGTVFEITCPVIFMTKSLGSVIIGMNKSVLIDAQRKIGKRILIVFAVIVVLGMFASLLLASFLIKPIQELSAGVEILKQGATDIPLKIYSWDELGSLTNNFNEMSALIAEQRGRLTKYAQDLEESYVSVVKVVAAALDARDSYTHGHSARVSEFSLLIGNEIGLSKEELDNLKIACLLHDVGKIRTPDSILLKPGKLNQAEYKEMMRHVEYGPAILDKAPTLRKYIPAIRHHHERQDGFGYPDGLSGAAIPLFAAIIGVADAFDAMTSDRPYRKSFTQEQALQELLRVSGTQLRADLVTVFVELMDIDKAWSSTSSSKVQVG